MVLSDISIKRPVICLVASIIVIIVGVLAYVELPVREYPETDSPIVSISTSYPGASAEVVENKITEIIEKQVSGIDGLVLVRSQSSEQNSQITLEFNVKKNIDEAANDVRDKVGRIRMPQNVNPPTVSKTDPDATPIITLSFNSDRHSRRELTEMVERFATQRLQTVSGVASVNVNGDRFAMRLWVDPDKLAAYGLATTDITRALQQQNVELPSGRIQSQTREFPVQLKGRLADPSEFENLVLARRGTYQVKFSDIGRVELGSADYRSFNYYNGRPTVSVSVLRQARANLLDVAHDVKAMVPLIRADVPEGVSVDIANDSSTFVERSVEEVKATLVEASVLVVLMIFLFLRDWRATFIPLVAIPVSVIGTFAVMNWMGFSINNLTLLALVLAVGLVVDDAIVMLENIYRRIEMGENPIHAAIFGARQVAFAIIATTLTLAAVFLPVAFQKGQTGRLFYEFGVTLAVSVLVSAFVALTITPMLCSRMLKHRVTDGHAAHGWLYRKTEPFFVGLNRIYEGALKGALRFQWPVLAVCLAFACVGPWLYTKLQRELTPNEDRGLFTVGFTAPDGSTPEYNQAYTVQMENILLNNYPEVARTVHQTGSGRGSISVQLTPWEDRTRKTQDIIQDVQKQFRENITGGQATVSAPRAIGSGGGGGGGRGGGGGGSGLQLVLQGSDFDRLQQIGQQVIVSMRDSPIYGTARVNPSPTKPQINMEIDRAKAADLRVPVTDIASTLQTLLGGGNVSDFQRGGELYDVTMQTDLKSRATPSDLNRLYVRSSDGTMIQLSNLVSYRETVVPAGYPHFNRLRSVTVNAQLNTGVTIGDAVADASERVKGILPDGYTFTFDGEARDFVNSASDTYMLFGLALLFTFLILAAQFESWIHPLTIFTGIVLAISGGLIVLYTTRWWTTTMTDNIFSRFGLIMLIGMVAKNGILVVEFANQLQVDGLNAFDAAYKSATIRFRPIIMTSIATVLGAVPIAFATGPGAESRQPMGIVVVGGLTIATFLTLFVVPIVYVLMDRLCLKLTGHNSAHGLVKAEQIERETAAVADSIAH
jgi:multidrug efflux pump